LTIGSGSEVNLTKGHIDCIKTLNSLKMVTIPADIEQYVQNRCKEIEEFYAPDFNVYFKCFLLLAEGKTITENYEKVLKMDENYIKIVSNNITYLFIRNFLIF
jgi:hypothetical protein